MEADRTLKAVIADDHLPLLDSLAGLLGAMPYVQVAGRAANGQEAVEKCDRLRPDLLFLDISMPGKGGIEAAKEIRERTPETRVVFVTSHDGSGYVRAAFAAGAAGYVLKSRLNEDLAEAVLAIRAGKRYVSDGLQSAGL
jgi:DNA-binding NarL/FixJ family response regulator